MKITINIFLMCILLNFSSITKVVASVEERRSELVKVIDAELSEVTRLNKKNKGRDPRLLLRMAELLLEKARLLKEKENSEYLSLSPERRRSVSKVKFFKRSTGYFKQAQKTCRHILKKFKRFKGRSEVYYILAYNSKEFQKEKSAKEYFKKAIKTSSKKTRSSVKSMMALAEMYFNQAEYRRAIALYEKSLATKKYRDKWYTKDLYNLAWSYFRIGKKTKATALMNKIYKLSASRKYVDMRKSVERDLAYFYTDSGETKKAVSFYKKSGKEITKNLIKVSSYLINQGKYTSAEKTLREALKYKKNGQQDIVINMKLLSLYDKFGKVNRHLNVSKKILSYYKQNKLSKDDVKILTYHLRRMSALLQKQALSKRYSTQKKLKKRKGQISVSYFEMLAEVDKKSSYKTMFLAAETAYGTQSFNRAVELYARSGSLALGARKKKYIRLSNEGMLAALGGKGVRPEVKEKYLEKVYLSALKNKAKGRNANKIYQRLFNLYISKKNVAQAEKTLYSYRKNFPRMYSKQEAMIAKIMDHYRVTGDRTNIRKWVKKINKNQFRVSKRYKRNANLLLLNLQFENVERATSKGDKKKALRLYVDMFKDKELSIKAKANSAYNITILFSELGDSKRTYLWAERSLDLMKNKDVKRFQSSFLLIAADLFSRGDFNESSHLYSRLVDKLCYLKSGNKKIALKNANVIYLAEGQASKSVENIKSSYRCNIPVTVIHEMEFELLNFYFENQRWTLGHKLLRKFYKRKKYKHLILSKMGMLSKVYRSIGKQLKASEIDKMTLSLYQNLGSRKDKIPLEGLDVIAMLKLKSTERLIAKFKKIKLSFPEQRFNKGLKSKFKLLDQITASGMTILNVGSGKGLVRSYRYLVSTYDDLVTEVLNVSIPGKSKEYVSSFKKSMDPLIRPLVKRSNDFRKEALIQMNKNKILSVDNGWFQFGESFFPEFVSKRDGVLMDRGGRR